MASRLITTITPNQDMSTFSSIVTGSTAENVVVVQFNDSTSRNVNAAALARLTEKLAEEGWI